MRFRGIHKVFLKKMKNSRKAKALEELIDVTKYRDACKIEICDLGDNSS